MREAGPGAGSGAHRRSLLSIAVFSFLVSLLIASRPGAAQESCATAPCHGKLTKGKVVHPVAESCDTCHQSVASPHPQKGKHTFKLAAPQAELCASCHEPFKKANVHAPVKEGTCTTCHDPHSSSEPKLLSAPAKELCVTCHSDHVEFKVVHGPVSAGECTICHTPHESASKALLTKEGAAICYDCHVDIQELMKKKNVHAAIEGGCTSCHNPHGSVNAKLLSENGAALCYSCHSAIGETVEKAKVIHAPLKTEKGCASCHSPHAADQAKLLAQPEKETCVGCHKAILTTSMTFLHKPIAEGKCTPCHDPHGSPNPKLLVKSFPAEPYVPYTDKEFELCFGCHNRDLLRYPDTSFATGFRDGERNLHFLHVNNKQKGRSCKLCHSVHGADNPKLIAEKVLFGSWNLPLKFVKSENGGSCAPGCHRPQKYERKAAATKTEPAAKPSTKPATPKK
jgi:predicted CXXCH cytochrome family protein